MEEFIIFAGIVLAIALGYSIITTFWPLLLIALVIGIIVFCVKKHNAEQQKILDNIRAQEAAKRIEYANKAKEDNRDIYLQILQCQSEQSSCYEQIEIAKKHIYSIETFLKMFIEFGSNDGQRLISTQKNELYVAQTSLKRKQEEEKELQAKIKENQRIIDAAN